VSLIERDTQIFSLDCLRFKGLGYLNDLISFPLKRLSELGDLKRQRRNFGSTLGLDSCESLKILFCIAKIEHSLNRMLTVAQKLRFVCTCASAYVRTMSWKRTRCSPSAWWELVSLYLHQIIKYDGMKFIHKENKE
jgi:hypothetical protein